MLQVISTRCERYLNKSRKINRHSSQVLSFKLCYVHHASKPKANGDGILFTLLKYHEASWSQEHTVGIFDDSRKVIFKPLLRITAQPEVRECFDHGMECHNVASSAWFSSPQRILRGTKASTDRSWICWEASHDLALLVQTVGCRTWTVLILGLLLFSGMPSVSLWRCFDKSSPDRATRYSISIVRASPVPAILRSARIKIAWWAPDLIRLNAGV